MKFTVNTKELFNALKSADQRVKKTDYEVYKTVRFYAHDDVVELTTIGYCTIRTTIKANIREEGYGFAEHKKLLSAVKLLPRTKNETLEMTSLTGARCPSVKVTQGTSSTTITAICDETDFNCPEDDFTNKPKLSDCVKANIDSLSEVTKTVTGDDERFNYVAIVSDGKTDLKMVSTNGHSLCRLKTPVLVQTKTPLRCTVVWYSLDVVFRNIDTDVYIGEKNRKVYFLTENTTIICENNTHNSLPDNIVSFGEDMNFSCSFCVKSENIKKLCKRVLALRDKPEKRQMNLTLYSDKNFLKVYSRSTVDKELEMEDGADVCVIKTDYTDKNKFVCINPSLLKDSIESLGESDYYRFDVTDEDSPIKITSMSGKTSIIMTRVADTKKMSI